MRLKKVLLAGAVAAMMAFGALAITACGGPSDEEVIREGVTEELESIKNLDQEFVDMLAADSGSSEFAAYGIDVTEFMTKYLEGFDYSIDGIAVNEDTADVTVTLTCKSFSGYMEQVEADTNEYVNNLMADPDAAANLSEDDINSAVGTIIVGALDKVEVAPTEPITVTYEKVDGQWTGSAETEDVVADALLSN